MKAIQRYFPVALGLKFIVPITITLNKSTFEGHVVQMNESLYLLSVSNPLGGDNSKTRRGWLLLKVLATNCHILVPAQNPEMKDKLIHCFSHSWAPLAFGYQFSNLFHAYFRSVICSFPLSLSLLLSISVFYLPLAVIRYSILPDSCLHGYMTVCVEGMFQNSQLPPTYFNNDTASHLSPKKKDGSWPWRQSIKVASSLRS